MRDRLESRELLKGATSATQSVAYPVADWKSMFLTLSTASNAEFTIKVCGSCSGERPDFSQAASSTNKWSFISIRDLEDGTNIDGTTGVSLEGTDAVNTYLVNTTGLRWIGVKITAYTAGSINVDLSGFSS